MWINEQKGAYNDPHKVRELFKFYSGLLQKVSVTHKSVPAGDKTEENDYVTHSARTLVAYGTMVLDTKQSTRTVLFLILILDSHSSAYEFISPDIPPPGSHECC